MTRPIIIASPADATLTPFGVEAAVRDVRQQINAAALAHQAVEAGA